MSAADSPWLRTRTASRAPRGSWPWMASSRPATSSARAAGGPDSSWAAARSAVTRSCRGVTPPSPVATCGGAAEFVILRSCHQAPTERGGAGPVTRTPGLGANPRRRVRKDDRMTEPVSPVQVRVARASDEAQLARLDRISWSPQSGFPSVMQQAGTVFFLTESPPQAFLVGEIDGVVVGYLRLGSPL